MEENRKESQFKCSVNSFNKILEEKFPNKKKDVSIEIQEAYWISNRLDQKRNSLCHIMAKH